MGTRAEPVDRSRLQDSLSNVRSDAGDVYRKSWIVVGHVENNPQQIDVVCEACIAINLLLDIYHENWLVNG
jgi:hypothetical protein